MLHENSDLIMKFRDEKNALLTEQNERQVLFCTVTSRLLHDDAKIRRGFITSWKKWREKKTVFRRNILIRTGDLIFFLYFNTLRLDLHSRENY